MRIGEGEGLAHAPVSRRPSRLIRFLMLLPGLLLGSCGVEEVIYYERPYFIAESGNLRLEYKESDYRDSPSLRGFQVWYRVFLTEAAALKRLQEISGLAAPENSDPETVLNKIKNEYGFQRLRFVFHENDGSTFTRNDLPFEININNSTEEVFEYTILPGVPGLDWTWTATALGASLQDISIIRSEETGETSFGYPEISLDDQDIEATGSSEIGSHIYVVLTALVYGINTSSIKDTYSLPNALPILVPIEM